MQPIVIRSATVSDIPAILELLAQDSLSNPPEGGIATPAHHAAFSAISEDPNHELIVATLDGQIVGTLQLSFIPGLAFNGAWRAQIEGVRVRAGLRNLRIGTQLMEWVIARAKERHCLLIQLTSNRARLDAQRFYSRLGFKTSHVGMKLRLDLTSDTSDKSESRAAPE
jgi:GNAT superfamily N-acetyltransferase